MPAAWPLTLPQLFLRPGNQETIPDGREISPMDAGPPKVRPRSSALGRPIAASWRMTSAQVDILVAFVRDDLAEGSLPFTIPSPRDGDAWLVWFAKGGLPSFTEIGGGKWTVSASLEVLP